MTSVQIPYSVAAALPSLVVLDVTNEVRHAVERAPTDSGIAYVFAGGHGVVRVNEREAGFFDDLERLLERIVPADTGERERLLRFLLGPRGEQVPFVDGDLCLGQWQRILVFGFGAAEPPEWTLTILG